MEYQHSEVLVGFTFTTFIDKKLIAVK